MAWMILPVLNAQNSTIKCTKCGSHYVFRVHRSVLEKLITGKRKYRCDNCKKKFFKKSLYNGAESREHHRGESEITLSP